MNLGDDNSNEDPQDPPLEEIELTDQNPKLPDPNASG